MLQIRFDELSIVIGEKANGPELTAAASIRDRFAEQNGIKIPVVNENERHLFKKNLLVIGTPESCAMLQKMKKPKYDGFLIDTDNEKIVLLGGIPRGTIYAADKFLKSIKIKTESFTIEDRDILEEPAFKTRFFMNYNMWNLPFKAEELDIMRHYRFNSCLFGINCSDAILLKESFPEIYNLTKDKKNVEKHRKIQSGIAEKMQEIHDKYAIDNYVYLTLGIPDHLRDAVYKTYPGIKGISRPDSYEKAHICPSDPMSWKIWHAIVSEVIELHPSAAGIYLDIMHDGYGINCQCDKCRANGLSEFPAELRKASLETYKVLKEHGKKLLYHTWSTNSKPRKGRSQGSDSGIPWLMPGDKPEWLFRQVIEWTPPEIELVKMDTWGDVQPTAPLDPLIGKVGKHPQIVQFQIAEEYRGFNKVPSSMVQYLKDRMSTCFQLGVTGVLVIVGGWIDPYYLFWKDIINSVNFEAFAKLSWNVNEKVEEIWNCWADKLYENKAAPYVTNALKMSQSVIEKSLAIKGMNFNDHSGYPTSIPRMWEITWDWSNYWYADSYERFAITLENIKEIINEKEEAVRIAGEMLSIIKKAKPYLKEKQYTELNERTGWLLHYVMIQRYLAEIYFRMLYMEEQSKKGETDAAQLALIEEACNRINEVHSKLPKSAVMESYYEELPGKDTPAFPILPWLPAHSAGHPVKFAYMMKERAGNLFYEVNTWKKMN